MKTDFKSHLSIPLIKSIFFFSIDTQQYYLSNASYACDQTLKITQYLTTLLSFAVTVIVVTTSYSTTLKTRKTTSFILIFN